MIIIDIFSNIYSCILFFPFLSYLIKKKRHITYYVMYGLLFDITLLNYYFTSTIIMLCIQRRAKIYLNSIYWFIMLL